MSSENEIENEIMQMALESVNSVEDANLLIQGNLVDALLVKAAVAVENRSGFMLFLFSLAKGDLLLVYSIFGNSPLVNRIRTFENVPEILSDLVESVKAGGIEKNLSDRIGRVMYKGIDSPSMLLQFPKIDKKDYSDFCNIVQFTVNTELKIKSVKVQMDVEKISSLDFRKDNPLAAVFQPISNPYKEVKKIVVPVMEDPNAQEKAKAEALIQELQKNFKHVVMCKTVVAPVAGVDFDNLKENMKLQFVLPVKTSEEIAIAKSLGAMNKDGSTKPIMGEFIRIIHGGKNEFHILAKGPNGVLFRAMEERPVKLALFKKIAQSMKKDDQSELAKMMSVIIGILLVLVIVLLFLYLA